MIRVRYIIFPLILLSVLCGRKSVHHSTAAEETGFEMPVMALKLLADAGIDPCPVCAENYRKKAFSLLNNYFKPRTRIRAGKSCGMMVTGECGVNEFVLSCWKGREFYKKDEKGRTISFPLVVFRFHTKERHLAGIAVEDYTDRKVEYVIKSLQSGTIDEGDILIIPFKYGDGPSFMYNRTDNRLIIHCRVVMIESGLRRGNSH